MACIASGCVLRKAVLIAVVGIGAGVVHSQIKPITLGAAPPTPNPDQSAPAAKPSTGTTSQPDAPRSSTPAAPAAPAAANPPAPAHRLKNGLSTAEVIGLYDSRAAEFIDARNADEFAAGHIPGAFSMPPEAFAGGKVPDALNIMARDQNIVVYCSGGNCDASQLVAQRIQGFGYSKVHIYEDGVTGWAAAGMSFDPPRSGGGNP